MCGPLAGAAIPAATQAASSVLGFMGQNQMAKANTTAANLSYAQSMNQIGQQEVQIDQQQSENTVNAMIQRITAQGRISASASSSGLDAATAGREQNAAAFASGRALSIEDINSENQRINVGNEKDQAFYARQSQENQVLPQSPLALALNLAKAGATGASSYAGFGGQFGGSTPDSSAAGASGGAGIEGSSAVQPSVLG